MRTEAEWTRIICNCLNSKNMQDLLSQCNMTDFFQNALDEINMCTLSVSLNTNYPKIRHIKIPYKLKDVKVTCLNVNTRFQSCSDKNFENYFLCFFNRMYYSYLSNVYLYDTLYIYKMKQTLLLTCRINLFESKVQSTMFQFTQQEQYRYKTLDLF